MLQNESMLLLLRLFSLHLHSHHWNYCCACLHVRHRIATASSSWGRTHPHFYHKNRAVPLLRRLCWRLSGWLVLEKAIRTLDHVLQLHGHINHPSDLVTGPGHSRSTVPEPGISRPHWPYWKGVVDCVFNNHGYWDLGNGWVVVISGRLSQQQNSIRRREGMNNIWIKRT